jgi:hypothetical protein
MCTEIYKHLLLHSKVTDNLVRCSQVKARNQIIKKLIQYQIVHLYAQHEIEDALVKYAAATDANRAELGVVWDEFWAFYAGSMETGTGNGVGAYTNAESRSDFFKHQEARQRALTVLNRWLTIFCSRPRRMAETLSKRLAMAKN